MKINKKKAIAKVQKQLATRQIKNDLKKKIKTDLMPKYNAARTKRAQDYLLAKKSGNKNAAKSARRNLMEDKVEAKSMGINRARFNKASRKAPVATLKQRFAGQRAGMAAPMARKMVTPLAKPMIRGRIR